MSKQELWFLCSAHRLMLVNICMKFHEDTLNGFKVTERTWFYLRNCYLQSSKGHNSKSIKSYRADTTISQNLLFSISKGHNSKNTQSRVTVLALCMSSHVALHLCKVSWKYLKWFLSDRADTILWQTDGQTDRQPGQKQYVSQPYRRRHKYIWAFCTGKQKHFN